MLNPGACKERAWLDACTTCRLALHAGTSREFVPVKSGFVGDGGFVAGDEGGRSEAGSFPCSLDAQGRREDALALWRWQVPGVPSK